MTSFEERPYAAKTDGELFLISEFLEREIKTLSEKNLAIQNEMRLRDGSGASVSAVLEYQRAAALNAEPGGIGDLYADRSRRYAIQITFIVLAIIIASVVCLVLIG